MPIWGPGNAGVTVIVERKSHQQTGYYGAMPWWANKGSFIWDGGNPNSYWGLCPFPPGGFSGTTHNWELSGMSQGADYQDNLNLNVIPVVQDVMRTQGLRINYNGGDKFGTFYVNLPSTSNDDVIQGPPVGYEHDSASFGNSNPPNPTFRFGDSPWTDFLPIERGSGDLGRIKVFNIILSQADMLSEAGDMTQLVTVSGAAHIWYGKTNWRSLSDLTCDYGTGRTFAWADATYKATLVAA